MKKAFLLLSIVIGLSETSKAQSVAYYPFSSILSVSTNPELRVWGDLRFQTNSFFSSLSTEIAPAINLNNNDKGRFYLGGGARLNYLATLQDNDILEGFFFNAGVRSAPFDKYPQVQIAFELSPYVASDFESGLLRTRLGVAYNFSRKSK
ncbi:hypothetical protein [Arcticibacterium luteifluviistationis]|uniref:Outer membrane protein beta-barrel domain-containing protein n=1 Tax=Arcticibacterium luteifluviistationis TaxID=1784714 RepID=A0A2Z4GFR6_9BACT|nr:hypothetical protein [Arcticibacterium luteifluviistationis]AWV99907.1 hypothetical protein DJ013_17710 [Arcticibacterium luteifluviistationis]